MPTSFSAGNFGAYILLSSYISQYFPLFSNIDQYSISFREAEKREKGHVMNDVTGECVEGIKPSQAR